jgi:multiple sugar transport system substrate-binding protein
MIDAGRQGMLLGLNPDIKRDARAVPIQDYVEHHVRVMQTPSVDQFALPQYLNVIVLYYNKTVLQRKGMPLPDDTWDWQKYRDALLRATERDQGLWGGLLPDTRRVMVMIRQNGGEIVDPNDDRKAVCASPAGLEALQWIHDRLWKDRTWAQRAEPRNAGYKHAFAMFAAGKLATFEEGSWAPADFAKEHPDAIKDWDIAPLPRGKQRVARVSTDGWVV